MDPPTLCKMGQYRLYPTPAQEQALETVLRRCRALYNAALEQRRTWWERGQSKGTSYYHQQAALPHLKAACPEYAEVHAHILQDVILRVERTFQAVFRRVQAGETPGYPRFHGRDRCHRFMFPEYGNGAVLDGGLLTLSKIGRIAIRVHRPLNGTPKTVTIHREADGWYACFSCAQVSLQPLAVTGHETGVDLGVESFATLADGAQIANPRIFGVAEMQLKRAQRRVSRRQKGSHRRQKGSHRR